MKGLDLSSYQRNLKMEDVKKAGYEFVILRGGYTGYGAGRTKNKDTSFEGFYTATKQLGIPVGAYWYSCANNRATGIAEAQYFYENCLKDKCFEYPVYIDIEEVRWQLSNKTGVTDAILGFFEFLESKGYYVGIYSSTSWFRNQIDTKRLDKYTKWVAAWRPTKPSFEYSRFDMWQYSEKGRICGVQVDLNVAYVDFPKLIKEAGKNGYQYIKGDIDNDGQVTAADARLAMRAAVNKEKLTEAQKEAADMDYDGKVTAADARDILRRATDKEIEYTVREDDTLTSIAKAYGTTVEKLKKANGLKTAKDIKVGQKLIIKG